MHHHHRKHCYDCKCCRYCAPQEISFSKFAGLLAQQYAGGQIAECSRNIKANTSNVAGSQIVTKNQCKIKDNSVVNKNKTDKDSTSAKKGTKDKNCISHTKRKVVKNNTDQTKVKIIKEIKKDNKAKTETKKNRKEISKKDEEVNKNKTGTNKNRKEISKKKEEVNKKKDVLDNNENDHKGENLVVVNDTPKDDTDHGTRNHDNDEANNIKEITKNTSSNLSLPLNSNDLHVPANSLESLRAQNDFQRENVSATNSQENLNSKITSFDKSNSSANHCETEQQSELPNKDFCENIKENTTLNKTSCQCRVKDISEDLASSYLINLSKEITLRLKKSSCEKKQCIFRDCSKRDSPPSKCSCSVQVSKKIITTKIKCRCSGSKQSSYGRKRDYPKEELLTYKSLCSLQVHKKIITTKNKRNFSGSKQSSCEKKQDDSKEKPLTSKSPCNIQVPKKTAQAKSKCRISESKKTLPKAQCKSRIIKKITIIL